MNGMPSFANPTNLTPRADPEAIEVPANATPIEFLKAVRHVSAMSALPPIADTDTS
jgi:hypothetical protein